MRLLTWNVNGLRAVVNAKGGLTKLLSGLEADVICFQETKLAREELREELSLTDGWVSFFDFADKAGYSGPRAYACGVTIARPQPSDGGNQSVATFCKRAWAPEAAVRGVTDSELRDSMAPDLCASLDAEGRCICTDHGSFVLFNVYIPALSNEEKAEVRMQYKMHVLACLHSRLDRLRQAGRLVAIAGDFNISPEPLDHCDPSADFFSGRPDRRWMRCMLAPLCDDSLTSHPRLPHMGLQCSSHVGSGNASIGRQLNSVPHVKSSFDTTSPAGGFVDTFRAAYPSRRCAYTCWSAATGARNNNWGTRIDLVLVADPFPVPAEAHCTASGSADNHSAPEEAAVPCEGADRDQVPWACCWQGSAEDEAPQLAARGTWRVALQAADIMPEVYGSDHAPSWCDIDTAALPARCAPDARRALPPEASERLLGTSGRQKQLGQMWRSGSTQRRSDSSGGIVSATYPLFSSPGCAQLQRRPAAATQAQGRGHAPQKRKATGGNTQAKLLKFLTRASQAQVKRPPPVGNYAVAVASPSVTPPLLSGRAKGQAEEVQTVPVPRDCSYLQTPSHQGSICTRRGTVAARVQDTHAHNSPSVALTGCVSGSASDVSAFADPAANGEGSHACPHTEVQTAAINDSSDLRACVSGTAIGLDTEALPAPRAAVSALFPHQGQVTAKTQWKTLMEKYRPVKCRGHDEPCVIRQVKKGGPNQGRLFYVCSRDDGPAPHGRCDFFQWVKVGQRRV